MPASHQAALLRPPHLPQHPGQGLRHHLRDRLHHHPRHQIRQGDTQCLIGGQLQGGDPSQDWKIETIKRSEEPAAHLINLNVK